MRGSAWFGAAIRSLVIVWCHATTVTLLLALFPLVGHDEGLSAGAIGALVTVYGAISLLFDPWFPRVVGWLGPNLVMSGWSTLCSIGCLLLALAPSASGLWFLAALAGLSACVVFNPALAAVTLSSPSDSERIQAVNAAAQRLGSLVAAALVWLAYSPDKPARLFAAGGLFYGVAAVTSLRLPQRARSARPRLVELVASLGRTFRIATSHLRLLQAQACSALTIVLYVIGGAFFPLIVVNRGGSSAELGLALACRDAVAVLAAPLFAPVVRRMGIGRTYLVAGTVGVTTLGASLWLQPGWPQIALFCVHGITISVGIATCNHYVTMGTPVEDRVYGFAIVSMSARFSYLVSPLLIGLVFTHASANAGLLVGPLLAVLLLGFYRLPESLAYRGGASLDQQSNP